MWSSPNEWLHSLDPWTSCENVVLLCVSLVSCLKLHKASCTLSTPGLQLDYLDKVLFENVYFMSIFLLFYFSFLPYH